MDNETQRFPAGSTPYLVRAVHPAIEDYLLGLHQLDHTVLLEMEALARERSFPIVGRLVGSFLQMMTLACGARRVFELGSGFGYSAWWFARAVGPGGTVFCTDGDPANHHRARGFLERAGLWDRIHFEVGVAQEMLVRTEGIFDIIYNDVDKQDYPQVWRLARERLAPGGLYIADNALWGGRVLFHEVEEEPSPGGTEAVKEHNRLIAADPDFDMCVNPVRDGVIVARKKGT